MRTLVLILTMLSLCLGIQAKPAAKNQAKKPAAKASVKKTSAKKTSVKKATSKKSAVKKAPAKPAAPQQPSTERYTEIEQALLERGYLDAADGNWSADSIAAMKKFQQDQGLNASGKITALSLTALGLGPRRGAFVVASEVIGSAALAVE